MPDLVNKLNVLVRASINNFVGSAANRAAALPAELLRPSRLGKDFEGEVGALRKQVEAAISQEDAMQTQLDTLNTQAAQLSAQADEALTRQDDANARYFVAQQGRVQQQASMLQTELEQHKRATSELIQHVNVLDSMLSDKRRGQVVDAPEVGPGPAAQPLADMLREARQASAANDTPSAEVPINTADEGTPIKIKINKIPDAAPDPDAADLARRRSRLSKPD